MLDLTGSLGGKGELVFGVVTFYTFLIALLAGVFLASDSLSAERRDGTLGVLFLTPLRSHDLVLGKFAAVSLNAFCGLFSIFPVLALSFLAGGVSAAEFWRTCLVLVNTLFFSVAATVLASAFSRSTYLAMARALCLVIGLMALAGAAAMLSSHVARFGAALFYMGAMSPWTSFHYAPSANFFHQAEEYWVSLAICNAAGWVFLGLATWRLRFFQDEPERKRGWKRIFAAISGQRERRPKLLGINPVLWLLDDSRRLRWVAWGVAVAGGATLLLVTASQRGVVLYVNIYMGWPFYFILKVFFAIQACRFFSEARRTGALEMLCCTPISTSSIISGQWIALGRIFLWPVIVLILSQLACLCFLGDPLRFANGLSAMAVKPGGVAVQSGAPLWPPDVTAMEWSPALLIFNQIANSIADFFAVGWFGMWLALSLKKPATATGLTILYVLVLPALAFCVPTLAIDVVFIVVGYSKLQQDFRGRGRSI
jgi:ABC-type transport system involved in multi-copper enzyme maturation permease subunit